MWHMVNKCEEMEQEYTGNIFTRYLNPPYLLSNPDELNIIADAMDIRLGICCKTHLIDCRCHHNGFDAVCKSTVNLYFLILQLKITIIQKIQQVPNNEGKWKEARHRQTKQWLIMLNQLPEDKE